MSHQRNLFIGKAFDKQINVVAYDIQLIQFSLVGASTVTVIVDKENFCGFFKLLCRLKIADGRSSLRVQHNNQSFSFAREIIPKFISFCRDKFIFFHFSCPPDIIRFLTISLYHTFYVKSRKTLIFRKGCSQKTAVKIYKSIRSAKRRISRSFTTAL